MALFSHGLLFQAVLFDEGVQKLDHLPAAKIG
jgi:hypothetical protein